jgi:hypothetical protein
VAVDFQGTIDASPNKGNDGIAPTRWLETLSKSSTRRTQWIDKKITTASLFHDQCQIVNSFKEACVFQLMGKSLGNGAKLRTIEKSTLSINLDVPIYSVHKSIRCKKADGSYFMVSTV